MSEKKLTGKILFRESNYHTSKKELKNLQTPSIELNFHDFLMSNFSELQLSDKEKQLLTNHHRQMLCLYKKLPPNILREDKTKLLSLINEQKNKEITISASEYGAYVCLAVAFSGKIPDHKTIHFTLENSPLALFPKELLVKKSLPKNLFIEYAQDPKAWVDHFDALLKLKEVKVKKYA